MTRALLIVSLGLVACDDAAETPLTPMADAGEQPPDAALLDHGEDTFDPRCTDPGWTPGACVAGVAETHENAGQGHRPDDEAITYDQNPPSSGDHRGQWARWGEYSALPPQRWLHNLEHGGVALLYHPCAGDEAVDALRAIAQAREPDFRWILTPYRDLPSAVAVVAWEWRYLAECVDADEIGAFIDRQYRMAPEDVAGDGSYDTGWIGR